MTLKNLLIIVLVLAVVAISFYSFQGGTDKSYIDQLIRERQAKNEFMKSSDDSPFGKDRSDFKELNYFPPDDRYRISAKLTPIQNKKMVLLPTSDEIEKKYLEYANAEFELNDVVCKLLILEIADEGEYRGTLFLAFADSTSA